MLESFAACVLSGAELPPQLAKVKAVKHPITRYEEKFFIIGYFSVVKFTDRHSIVMP
jgi:hypothetical protein